MANCNEYVYILYICTVLFEEIILSYSLCSGGLELLCASVKRHDVDVNLKTGEDQVMFLVFHFFSPNSHVREL